MRFALTAVSLSAAMAVACTNSDPPGGPSSTVSSVAVAGTAPAIGQSAQFTATASFANGTEQVVSSTASWLSSNPSVATVSGGLVAAVSAGTTDISAAYRGVSGTARITIGGSPPVTESFTQNYIQSLFLGSGPLTPSEGTHGCPRLSLWAGFPPGTQVRVRASAVLRQEIFSALTTTGAQVPDATAGALSVSVESTPEENPLPSMNEVTVATSSNAQSLGCPLAQGCTIFRFLPPYTLSARAILSTVQPVAAYVHDAIGHGVLGLCHVDGNLIGGSRLSLMSFGVGVFSNNLPSLLTAFDLAAIQPVFRSGLLPGSTLFDFTRVGLVGKPGSTSSAQSTRSTAVHTAVIDAPPTR